MFLNILTIIISLTTAVASSPSVKPSVAPTRRKPTITPTIIPTVLTQQQTVCIISLPSHPLSAAGLATPWTVTGCDQANPAEASFAEGVLYDTVAKTFAVFNPLVINAGTTPAIYPTQPTIRPGVIVGVWFGSNAGAIRLTGPGFAQGNCTTGLPSVANDIFGQFAYCNAVNFFAAANKAPNIPALGQTKLGQTCQTTLSFSVVDQDPADNCVTKYLVTSTGKLAQFSSANLLALKNSNLAPVVVDNGSDNKLLVRLNEITGCQSFLAPDLANNGVLTGAAALNALSALRFQAFPQALIPRGDPMVRVNGASSQDKTNLYRLGVNQPINILSNRQYYCSHLMTDAPARFLADQSLTIQATSPAADVGSNMFTFLCARYLNTLALLDCANFVLPPLSSYPQVSVSTDANGVAIACQIIIPPKASPTIKPSLPPSTAAILSLTGSGSAAGTSDTMGNTTTIAVAVSVSLAIAFVLLIFILYMYYYRTKRDDKSKERHITLEDVYYSSENEWSDATNPSSLATWRYNSSLVPELV